MLQGDDSSLRTALLIADACANHAAKGARQRRRRLLRHVPIPPWTVMPTGATAPAAQTAARTAMAKAAAAAAAASRAAAAAAAATAAMMMHPHLLLLRSWNWGWPGGHLLTGRFTGQLRMGGWSTNSLPREPGLAVCASRQHATTSSTVRARSAGGPELQRWLRTCSSED